MHLLLSLGGLELRDLLMELADSLKAAIAELAVDVRAARQYFQLIAQEQVVILARSNLVENATTLSRLWDLDRVDGGEDLRSSLGSWRWRRYLPAKLPAHGQTERCAKYTVFLLHPVSKLLKYFYIFKYKIFLFYCLMI